MENVVCCFLFFLFYPMKKICLFSFLFIGVFFASQSRAEVMCTMEYAPVCGKVQIQCIKAPCEPILQTFSNRCMLEANKLATFMRTGECEKNQQECWKIIDNKKVRTCNRLPNPEECPRFTPPSPSFCPDWVIVDWWRDVLWCQLPPRCEKNVAMKNPASVHCLKLWWKLEIKEISWWQQGICVFDDWTICDERALFRWECEKKTRETGQNFDLHDCVVFFDGCNTCTVSGGKVGSCTKMYCTNTGTAKCLVYTTTKTSLDQTIQKVFAKYKTPIIKERAIRRFLDIIQQKSHAIQIQWKTLTDKEQTALSTYHLLILVLEEELRKVCIAQKGVWIQAGRWQVFTCKKKTPDAGKKCTSNEQCSTLCLAPGRCAPTTVNIGCFDVMKDGRKVKICID